MTTDWGTGCPRGIGTDTQSTSAAEHRVKIHVQAGDTDNPSPASTTTPTGHQFTGDHTGTHPVRASSSAYERALAALVDLR
jgi:hypothetical protein